MEFRNLRPTRYNKYPKMNGPGDSTRKEKIEYSTQKNYERYQSHKSFGESRVFALPAPINSDAYNVNTKNGANVYPTIEGFVGIKGQPILPVSLEKKVVKHEPKEEINTWLPKTHRTNISHTDDRIYRDTRSEYRVNLGQ